MKWVLSILTLGLGFASAHAQYASFAGVQGPAFNNVNVAPTPFYNPTPYYQGYVTAGGGGNYGFGSAFGYNGYGSSIGGYGFGGNAGYGNYGGFGYASGFNLGNYGVPAPAYSSPQVIVIDSSSGYGSYVGNNFGAGYDASNYQSPYRPFIPSVYMGYNMLRPVGFYSPFYRN